MDQTTIIVNVIGTLITSGVVGGIITFFTRRENNRMRVEMAKIKNEREEKRDESAVNKGLVSLATTIAQMFEPFRQTLEDGAKATSGAAALVKELMERADKMHETVVRRDQEAQQDRDTAATRHTDIVARLDRYQGALDNIARQVTINTDENTLRHQFSMALLLIKEIGVDTKRLINRDLEQPGEVVNDLPEKKPKQTKGENDHAGNPS